MDRENSRLIVFLLAFFVGVPAVVMGGAAAYRDYWPPEVARRAAVDAERSAAIDADQKRWEAEQSAMDMTVLSDIAKCSTVTDEIRCTQAFQCRRHPEQCVFEYGDPDIVLDGIRQDAMNDDQRGADY